MSDAPNLGDLVVDRLAQRQVDPASIAWDAVRRETEPWEVVVTFVAAGRTREARWRVDLARHVLTATDDESRWLSETDMGAASRRHLNAVDAIARGPRRTSAPPPAYDAPDDTQVDAAGPTDTAGTRDTAGTAAEPAPRRDAGEELLDQLAASRGTRQELADPEDDEFEDDLDGGFDEGDADEVAGEPDRALVDGDDPWGGELPGAHPAESHPDDAPDAAILALPAPTVTEEVAPVADPEPAPTPAPASASRSEAKSEPQSEPQPDREPESEPEPALEPHDTAEDHPTLDVPVPAAKPAAKARRKSSRRSVPSWDEIVFGTRSD